MAYDPYRRIMTPDQNLPEWVPMGDDDNQGEQVGKATGSFVDLLKKRMAGSGGSKGGAMPGAEGKAMDGGGGMQSL